MTLPFPTVPTRRKLALAAALMAGALSALAAPLAAARCSRDIVVPFSPNSGRVFAEGNEVRGIYPDLLRSVGPKAGCQFVISLVPRARQVAMFENGTADLLLPASRTAARDKQGIFVPMLNNRAMIISTNSNRPPITSAKDLLDRRDLRVAVVRGFDYGEQYMQLVRELGKQGRVFSEVDANAVARLLQAGSADVTIMGPTVLAAAIEREPRVAGLQERLRLEAIPELSWKYSGAYISRRSLSAEDQAALRELLDKMAKSGAVMEGYQRAFSPELLNEAVRGR
jgi:polar amino acid transport system substrate-binding protein